MVVRDAPDTDTTDVPYFTSDLWTGELEGLWTETESRTAGDTAIDMDRVYGPDGKTDTDTPSTHMRYEDALRRYLNGNAEPSLGADTAQTADLDVEPVKESKTPPKPRE